jgi:hypothetical protein
MPKMRDAIENKWEPFLQNLTRAASGAGFHSEGYRAVGLEQP